MRFVTREMRDACQKVNDLWFVIESNDDYHESFIELKRKVRKYEICFNCWGTPPVY
jgi:hypothetical protein